MIPSRSFRNFVSEAIGTYALVFFGTGAIVVNDLSNGAITHLGIAMAFGLVVLAMIYVLGDISGAHLNPAVTLSFVWAKRLPCSQLIPYLGGQIGGACGASLSLHLLFPLHDNLGSTLPAGSSAQAFALETLLSYFLVFVIFKVSTGAKEKGITAGLVVGAVVGLEALVAGPVCGASMNPVRSLAPALISGHFEALWVYLSAPFLGGLIAWGSFSILHRTALH